jgi:membrane protease YdiL (CAAX protease family)
MAPEQFSLRTGSLAGLLVPAAVYLAWHQALPQVTPNDFSYGIGGILLGLFICSRPARNGIDVLMFERVSFRRVMRGASGLSWLLLNALVMLAGWLVIVIGALRLSIHPD